MHGGLAARDDVGWTAATAANSFGSSRPNYAYTLNPGGRLDDALVVANHGTTPLDLAVYAADGFTTDQGQLDLRTKDATSTRVGAWIHPEDPSVAVQPGQSVEVPFTLALPDSAAPGDYLGGIVTSQTSQGRRPQRGAPGRTRRVSPRAAAVIIEFGPRRVVTRVAVVHGARTVRGRHSLQQEV